jgi:DNA polymerase-3 subunit beta
LHAAFQHVGNIVTSTVARPIYQNVKMEAISGSVFLSATDLEVGVRINAGPAEIEEEGHVLLPEARVSSILGATPDETVSFAGDESSVNIWSEDGVFRMVAEDPADFVDIPELSDEGVIELDPQVLQYMVRRVVFAVAEERGRYALNGVLLMIDEEGNFEMTAADGARLANVRKKASNSTKQAVDCIVMRKGLEQAARLAGLSDQPLMLLVTDSQMLAENEAGRLCCQRIEGLFPNYREVIPSEGKFKVELPIRPLLNGLTRAAFLTTEQARAVDFTFTDGLLTLRSQSPDVGEAEVRMSVDYKGEELTVAFNPNYIADMLKAVERDTVRVDINDGRSPCVWRSGGDYQYVVSPVVRED